jgi:hypothetical protein
MKPGGEGAQRGIHKFTCIVELPSAFRMLEKTGIGVQSHVHRRTEVIGCAVHDEEPRFPQPGFELAA